MTDCTQGNTLTIDITFVGDDPTQPRYSLLNYEGLPAGLLPAPHFRITTGTPVCLRFRIDAASRVVFDVQDGTLAIEWIDVNGGMLVLDKGPGYQSHEVPMDKECIVHWGTDKDAFWTATMFHLPVRRQGETGAGATHYVDPTVINKPHVPEA